MRKAYDDAVIRIRTPYKNGPEYTISYGRVDIPGDTATDTPVMAISLKGGLIRLVGDESAVAHYRAYFSDSEGGWGRHLEEDKPLTSFWEKQSMTQAVAVSQAEFDEAVATILKNGGEQSLVTW